MVDGGAARSMRVLRGGCRKGVPLEGRLVVEILNTQVSPLNPTTCRRGREYLQTDVTSEETLHRTAEVRNNPIP